jgi:signal transduction histidine kinase
MDPTGRAADAILDLLAGSLDECARDLAQGDVPAAQKRLAEVMDQLRRIRRDLREEGGSA